MNRFSERCKKNKKELYQFCISIGKNCNLQTKKEQQQGKEMAKKELWNTAHILKSVGGILLSGNPDTVFSGISIDSRTISANDFFIAIEGEVHDGHLFTRDVIAKGVQGLMISEKKIGNLPCEEWKKQGISCIAVKDTIRALGDLAAYRRKSSGVSLVAVTGSNGKTTVRQMLSSIFSIKYRILSTKGNFNNEIGLPLTLLELEPEHEWAVVELGMNRPGEIRRLARICQPDIGIITNIGPAHLEGLGSLEAVARAKGELLEEMSSRGIAVLSADDPACTDLAEQTVQETITFGFAEEAQVKAVSKKRQGKNISFIMEISPEMVPVDLRSPAEFMISNALAAAAAAYGADFSPKMIARGLSYFRPVEGRMNIYKSSRGFHIIDDTYNANPASVKAALRTLALVKQGRGIAVLGDMLELGRQTDSLHKEIGMFCAASGIEKLFLTGSFAETVAEEARKNGMNRSNICIAGKEEILAELKRILQAGDWVLIKGSRGMKMEVIPEGLKEEDKEEFSIKTG